MTQRSFPFAGGGGGDDGPYSATFFAQIFEDLFYQSPNLTDRNNAGVILGTGDGTNAPLLVTESSPVSNNIEIKVGSGLVNGYYYNSDANEQIQISANADVSGDDRIDIVVLEWDSVSANVRLAVEEGTVAASPVAPTPTRTATIYQVVLAEVTVTNGFTNILNADIDNTVRNQALLWQPEQGGTGLEGGYVSGDVIVAQGAEDLTTINLGDGEYFVGDTSETPPFSTIHGGLIETFGAVSNAPGGTFTKITLTDLNDPTGYASIVSGALRLEPGVYEVVSSIAHGNIDYSTNNVFGIAFYDANGTTNIVEATIDRVITGVGVEDDSTIVTVGPMEFTVTSNTHDYEYQLKGTGVGFVTDRTKIPATQKLYLRRVR